MVPGFVLFWVPLVLLAPGGAARAPLRFLAPPLWVIGLGMLLWCALDFVRRGRGTPAPIDPPRELVATGLYRFVRNPMYLGALFVLLGHAALFSSLGLLLYAGAVFLAFHLFVVLYEEPRLARRFGERYHRYRRRVPRWLPRLRRP